jgi:5-methylthioadenosine/S-adenosylhomocysteine deaminase
VHGMSEALLTRVRRVADELDARVAVHLAELAGPSESADAAALTAGGLAGVQDSARAPRYERPLRQLHALGLLRPGFTAIGAGSCDGADLELLARHGASLIACPQADLRLGERTPVAALEGNRTGLGTDSPVAAGGLDLLAEARTAALHSGLAAPEVLRMATLGGATVLGLLAQIGSIEPGKAADLICIDLGALSGQPAAAIADAIVFGATRAQVSDVWTAGRLAVSAARLVAGDEQELAGLPARWAQRLRMEAAA